ncbi:hypothetical protein AAFN85_01505 [Mucilaginibacter sp. CAU 1740]|uniref:hypothetical protein n=1 Tax=Mucilaginibacter sp. CAU 1740 TaxID=3140365 RepID=UPI00325A5660
MENEAPAPRYHASAEEAITVKSIAEAIGKELNLPVVSIAPQAAAEHFGWFAHMAAIDCPASSEWTQQTLNWKPIGPALLEDIANGIYTK